MVGTTTATIKNFSSEQIGSDSDGGVPRLRNEPGIHRSECGHSHLLPSFPVWQPPACLLQPERTIYANAAKPAGLIRKEELTAGWHCAYVGGENFRHKR